MSTDTEVEPSPHSFIYIAPKIDDDGNEYKPEVEIFWNSDTKKVDLRHSGEVSEAAIHFFDELLILVQYYADENSIWRAKDD